MDGPPGAFISVGRTQKVWLAGLTFRDGISEGLTQSPTSMAQFAPAETGCAQGQLCPQGWAVPLVGVSRPSIFSALCPGKQDLAGAQPAVPEV